MNKLRLVSLIAVLTLAACDQEQDLALLQSAKAEDLEQVQLAIEIGAPFPEDLRARFFMGCVGRGAQRGDDLYYVTSFCTCTFDAMSRGMTVDEYKEMESLQRAGKKVPEIPQLSRVWDDIQACKDQEVAITDKPLTRADTSEYSVPIPSGFFVPNTLGGLMPIEEVRGVGGLILVQRRTPALDNGFLGSIVVAPIGTNDVDPTDEALCRSAAEQAPGIIESIRIVQGKNGPRCEAKKRDPEQATRGATFSIFASASGSWGVTCNYDTRDNQAIEACAEVLDGWRAK